MNVATERLLICIDNDPVLLSQALALTGENALGCWLEAHMHTVDVSGIPGFMAQVGLDQVNLVEVLEHYQTKRSEGVSSTR